MVASSELYAESLRQLQGIREVELCETHHEPKKGELVITVGKKKFSFRLWVARSHLSREQVDFVRELASRSESHFFIFAPLVGREVASLLDEVDINFVDRAGNCRVRLGDAYLVRVEGRRFEKVAPREREMRGPSLVALFAFLAYRESLNSPVRTVSRGAGGISPQTVSDLKKRLLAEEWIYEGRSGFEWSPSGKAKALDFLALSAERFAKHLELGRFRSKLPPLELERELAARLETGKYWWGGGAAATQRSGFYRGAQTVVYLDSHLPDGRGLLLPEATGDTVFRRLPGLVALDEDHTLSPLLIYLDLLAEGESRAREAASEWRERFLE